MLKKNIFRSFYFLAFVYLTGISIFTLFRISFLMFNIEHISSIPDKFLLIAGAFFMGFRFDTVISAYILLPVAFILFFLQALKQNIKIINLVILWYLSISYILAFSISAADIPYFKQFFSRFTIMAFNWMDSPDFVFKMIFQEVRYFIFIIAFLLIAIFFIIVLKKIYRRFLVNLEIEKKLTSKNYLLIYIFVPVIILGIIILGARGRIAEKSPIQTGTAYFSDNPFINQMGLNPVFTFIRSYLDSLDPEKKNIHLMNDDSAIQYVRKEFGISGQENYFSPILRKIIPSENSIKANIVVIIMESMSAELMQRFCNKQKLTPFLDSIAQNSICFDSIYTSGIHTMNGIYSTLFAYPALLRQHPMNIVEIPEYNGFSKVLKNQNFSTYYFTNHDEQFDNVGGFMKANHFDEIISQKDYPSKEILSTLGVPDHYLFEFSVNYISNNYNTKRPFFAAYMTSSNHGPYIIPEGIDFHPHNAETKLRSIEYADWSLRHFIKLASHQPWFDSTIFVFIADHGMVVGETKYDIPLSYHHTPLIIYSKMFNEKKIISEIGGQIDVFPTIMGLLNINYDNNTMGVDLLKEKRKYIYFSSDDIIGCLDKKYFYIYREDEKEALYLYRQNDNFNYINDFRNIADSMRNYTFSMLQTTQWLISHKKTGDK